MRKMSLSIGAGSIAASAALVFLLASGSAAMADEATAKPPISSSTKPHLGNGPADEKSLPSSAPSPSATATTGSTNQDKTVKAMNNNEKAKIEATGK